MASISISGIGSGIDFNAVRDAIINQRSIPIQQLQSRVNNYNRRTESLKELNLLLTTLTTTANDLTKRDVGTGRTATAADPAIAGATGSAGANLGSLNLTVNRLASSFTQASRSFASADAPILAGGAASATFELRLGGAAEGTEITIDASNNSLQGLRDAINAAGAGISASIIDLNGDGTQQQLVLNSTETGARGRVELVETSATGTVTDLNLRSLNPPDGDITKLDASLTINGLDIIRSSNTISDAVEGLNLELKKTGSTTIDVTRSNDIEEKLEAFVTAYNAIHEFINTQYKKDANGRTTGVLAGDAVLRNIQRQVSSMVNTGSADNGGTLSALHQIGITTDRSGKMEFDKDVLKQAITTNINDVRALLYGNTTGQTGVFNSLHDIADDLSDNITGTVQTAINGYEATVKNLNSTIEKRTALLNDYRDMLTRRFAAADAAIGQLNGQGTAIGNLMKTLQGSRD